MKIYILLVMAFAAQISYGQSVFPANGGNVGIGTTNPLAKLEVNSGNILVRNLLSNTDNESSIMIAHSINYNNYDTFGTSIRTITQSAGYNTYGIQFFTMESFLTGQTEKIRIQGNGNVGIGTLNPTSKLELINSTAGITSFKSVGINGYVSIDNVGSGENYYSANKFQEFQINGVPKMRINSDGNIGIGTTNPLNKLDVNGTIHSKEVKVDMTGWSDFVFKKGYNLPTLEQVEKHIFKNGHLENIPSEKEVLENGINLGEMNAKLLQKIEELTLYMIEIKKENIEMKNENLEMKKRIEKIEKK